MREEFNGLRWIVRADFRWRMMPNHLPAQYTAYQQTQSWMESSGVEDMVHHL
ncbi:MAG: hypothetical protein EHM40_01205 [Chloroflexi bacterium]|nr:MAG: hypothetical protein EHM40_19610 [Chloroflexota bacterium]RPI96547.1 MAG: hypothetical protein EHM40_01205 [Chloroflexota bacterium]